MNKEAMYHEHKYFMDYIVYNFLSKYPSFYYMKEDLQAECYLKFMELTERYDGSSCEFITFLGSQLPGYLHHRIRAEIILGLKTANYRDEYGVAETETYEMGDVFEEMLENAELTERAKTILRMKFVQDMSEAEIGKELGVSQQAVNRQLQRSYAKIKDTYE
jgi:RNA polymerase sigma factor (sigma-70 family)